ncbi:MAG: hypothetical protein ACYTEL_13395 [Planctomycetota bacterium]
MTNKVTIGLILLQIVFTGCAPTRIWISQPAAFTAANQYYEAELEPLKNGNNYFNSFRLTLTNKTENDFTIDWNKTLYLYNNKAYGRFVFAGVDKDNVHNLPPDLVSAGSTLIKTISPLKMVAWKSLKTRHADTASFSRGPIPAGENGIYLVVSQDGRQVREKITLTIRFKTDR